MKKPIQLTFTLLGILLVFIGMRYLWTDFLQPKSTLITSEASSEKQKQKNHTQEKLVTISIHGKSQQILDATAVSFCEGDTALNLLTSIAKSKHIQIECRGLGAASYVIGIANLYERDYGNQSGWMYRVNGKSPSVSSSAYRMRAGDNVEWIYSTNLGKDMEAALR